MKNDDSYYHTWWLLFHSVQVIRKARKIELNEYGISSNTEAGVLFLLHNFSESSTPTDLSHHLLREQHTISELIDRMEQKGLVEKTKNPDRKYRRVKIVLTKQGREAYRRSLKRGSMANILSALSEEEQQQLRSYLLKIREKGRQELGYDWDMVYPPLP